MENIILPILLASGIVAGILANRLPLSGVAALLLTAAPVAGIACGTLFC